MRQSLYVTGYSELLFMCTIISSTFRSTTGHLRENNIIVTGEITDGFTFSKHTYVKVHRIRKFCNKLNDLKFGTMELN